LLAAAGAAASSPSRTGVTDVVPSQARASRAPAGRGTDPAVPLSTFFLGAHVARGDSLAVLRPLRVVAALPLVPERLYLDLDATSWLVLIDRRRGDAHEWRLGGDFAPAAACGLWLLATDALLDLETTAGRVVAAPAALVAGLAVLQPRVRWQPWPALGLTAGWGSAWHLFHDETGLSWQPCLGAVVAPVPALRLEGGATYDLFWSFADDARSWGWGWYAGLRITPDFR
jgi:hypothetical protein